ncbi:12423_t:CDS:1, partial [Gigaspora rosea]
QTKKEIIGKILEKISSQLKKRFSFKIKGKIRSKTCLPEFAKLLKQIGKISDILQNVSNEADEDKFYEEMQHMIDKLSDEI